MFVDLEDAPRFCGTLERVQTHLERSKSCPLSITLSFLNFNLDHSMELITPSNDNSAASASTSHNLLMLILQHAHRIRRLSVVLNHNVYPAFVSSFLPHFRGHFTDVTEVTLTSRFGGDSYAALDELSELPLIRSVSVHHGAVVMRHSPTTFPIPQVTNLSFDMAEISYFFTILSLCQKLQYMEVALWVARPLDKGLPAVSHSGMRCLDLTLPQYRSHFDDYTELVKFLTFPALTCFSFALRCITAASPHQMEAFRSSFQSFVDAFACFIARCPSIEEFSLDDSSFEDQHLLLFLNKMPNVVALDVRILTTHDFGLKPTITPRVFKELGDRQVLPQLKDLRLEIAPHTVERRCSEDSFLENGVFEEMLVRRRESQEHRLRSAYLKVRQLPRPPVDCDVLRKLRREGLAVRVVHHISSDSYSPGAGEVDILPYVIDSI
ncbi:hypothetical protein VNI00_010842 [Paramarasmius palmivorus]|uniref:Uncharacterized protein n=1 Tax=Paramarasmius palmivorus TaxID=297713 RepID=A0AAW0CF98_9AGAR